MAYRDQPIDHPSVWSGAELAADREWIHHLSAAEITELDDAVAASAALPVTEITRHDAPLPTLGPRLAALSHQIDAGRGVAMLRGVPVDRYDADQAGRALWCLGQYAGTPFPQDAARNLLHHVRDTGGNLQADPNLRGFQTNNELYFHTDGGDLFMLLCRRQAKAGGRSRLASAAHLFNCVLAADPRLARVLQEPFYFDARGQQLPGQPRTQCLPVMIWHGDRLNILHKRAYIDFAQRFEEVPPLSDEQRAALDLLDQVVEAPENHHAFDMAPGDIQMASNFSVLHARDTYVDFDAPDEKRHMLRLWLAVEAGRPLPEAYRTTREHGHLFTMRATG